MKKVLYTHSISVWNTVEGEEEITSHDEAGKTLSGTFEFVVEKFEYSSKDNKKRPRVDVRDGKFTNITYKIEEVTHGK